MRVAFLFTVVRCARQNSTFAVFGLGGVTEEVRDFMLRCVQGLTQGAVFATQIVVSLLGANEFRFQAEEFVHDRFSVCLRLLELFFERQFHVVKVGF